MSQCGRDNTEYISLTGYEYSKGDEDCSATSGKPHKVFVTDQQFCGTISFKFTSVSGNFVRKYYKIFVWNLNPSVHDKVGEVSSSYILVVGNINSGGTYTCQQ
jgi:hypothetical protein